MQRKVLVLFVEGFRELGEKGHLAFGVCGDKSLLAALRGAWHSVCCALALFLVNELQGLLVVGLGFSCAARAFVINQALSICIGQFNSAILFAFPSL